MQSSAQKLTICSITFIIHPCCSEVQNVERRGPEHAQPSKADIFQWLYGQ